MSTPSSYESRTHSNGPHAGSRTPLSRRGLTLLESTVALVVVVVVVIIALPTLVNFRERGRRLACEANLFRLGHAVSNYRTGDSANAYPSGATYHRDDGGTSWWLAIMPFADMPDVAKQWQKNPEGGHFNGEAQNPNFPLADGLRQSIFQCPSSPLPPTNDPRFHLNGSNRRMLGDREPAGVAVPTYAAVAGGAPDARDIDLGKLTNQPHGRNTADGRYGILSGSGVMPVNDRIADAAVRDPKAKTIILVEQSAYGRNDAVDPPDLYDLRSAWPNGLLMGSTGDYHKLSPTAAGVNGDGSARVWNVTTLRYPINTLSVIDRPGFVVDPAPPRAANPDEPPPPAPPYPPGGYGPGHNHGNNSAHPGGAHALMADGSVRFFNESLELSLLLMFATRDDGLDSNDQ